MAELDRLAPRPSWLLGRAAARSHQLVAEGFAAEGVRGYHFRILAALDQFGPSSQADVGRHTGIDRSDVAATVNDLAARSFVVRAPDPSDGRRNVVSITRAGRAALERLDRVVDGIQAELLAPLTEREQASLLRLLQKLVVGSG